MTDLPIRRRRCACPGHNPERLGLERAPGHPSVMAQFLFVIDFRPKIAVHIFCLDHGQSDIGFDGR